MIGCYAFTLPKKPENCNGVLVESGFYPFPTEGWKLFRHMQFGKILFNDEIRRNKRDVIARRGEAPTWQSPPIISVQFEEIVTEFQEIATPVCALARNDIRFSSAQYIDKL